MPLPPAAIAAPDIDSIVAPFADDLARVERSMREGIRSVAPLITQVAEHTLASGGKRIRPLLVLLTAQLCGYRGPRAIQIAGATEYLHSATLLHDDVVDGADTRRGQPSASAAFGPRLAILVGDFLNAHTCSVLVEDGDADILASFADSIRAMAEGEVLQLARSFDPEMTESTYLEIIGRKTSSLLATGCEAGAILGKVTRPERRALRSYGWELGLAFQLVDDALDYSGDGAELGKAPLTDLGEGKVTLPLLLTLKRCGVAEREFILQSLKSFALGAQQGSPPDPEEIARVAECVKLRNGVHTTLQQADERAAEARAHIEPFVDCEAKRALAALTHFVVRRKS